MAIDECRDIVMFDDGENFIKVIFTGMGAAFGKAYHVYSYINGVSNTYEFANEYCARKFYERLCFYSEQSLPVIIKYNRHRTIQK